MGSVFSPYYAWARRRGPSDPTNHCAVNVALYGTRGNGWAMTERGRGRLARDRASIAIGPSSLSWDGAGLTIRIDERTVPWLSRISGVVRLRPNFVADEVHALDDTGAHRWRPVAPSATVEVALDEPGVHWTGPAYFDMNTGDAALETAFRQWTWSRTITAGGTTVLYDVQRRQGEDKALALSFDAAGATRPIDLPPLVPLSPTRWRLPRATRAAPQQAPRVVRTLEDAPFYARSVIETQHSDGPAMAVHESLSLDRFRLPIVQAMLPFRMPRRAG